MPSQLVGSAVRQFIGLRNHFVPTLSVPIFGRSIRGESSSICDDMILPYTVIGLPVWQVPFDLIDHQRATSQYIFSFASFHFPFVLYPAMPAKDAVCRSFEPTHHSFLLQLVSGAERGLIFVLASCLLLALSSFPTLNTVASHSQPARHSFFCPALTIPTDPTLRF